MVPASAHQEFQENGFAKLGIMFDLDRDQPGEVGLSILVDDTPTIAGTTVFIKGSHRWPAAINYLRWIYPNLIRRLLAGTVGIAGEVYLFYNSTWHGRMETDSTPRTALILTFLPESESVNRRPTQGVIASLGPNLQSLLTAQLSVMEGPPSEVTTGPDQYVSKWYDGSLAVHGHGAHGHGAHGHGAHGHGAHGHGAHGHGAHGHGAHGHGAHGGWLKTRFVVFTSTLKNYLRHFKASII